jgi:dipeptidyl aminopeptidase/acylaminoacyl peptidase
MHSALHRLLPALLAILPSVVSAQSPRVITVADLTALKTVGPAQDQPRRKTGGLHPVHRRSQKDRNSPRIWMSALAGGPAIPMTGAGLAGSNPKWSPDGKFLGFTAARNGGESQVWTLNRWVGRPSSSPRSSRASRTSNGPPTAHGCC